MDRNKGGEIGDLGACLQTGVYDRGDPQQKVSVRYCAPESSQNSRKKVEPVGFNHAVHDRSQDGLQVETGRSEASGEDAGTFDGGPDPGSGADREQTAGIEVASDYEEDSFESDDSGGLRSTDPVERDSQKPKHPEHQVRTFVRSSFAMAQGHGSARKEDGAKAEVAGAKTVQAHWRGFLGRCKAKKVLRHTLHDELRKLGGGRMSKVRHETACARCCCCWSIVL